jgi:DNA processing protein
MILTDEQRLDWLRLIRSENVGPRTFRALINQYGGAAAALDALPDLARRGGRLLLKVCSRAEAEKEMAAATRLGVRFIAMGEPDYPKTLQAVDTAPPLIALRGNASVLAKPSVAIVGSRNASASGLTFAERLARQLGEAGYVVISGLARGIDTRAHKATLETGTVAVLAGGHDRIYPSQNEPLLQAILEQGGAVVSEMPMGWEPRGRDFPAATASCPACPMVSWWWRRRGDLARSSPRASPWSRDARSLPCRAHRSTLVPRAPTISSVTAQPSALESSMSRAFWNR